MVRLEGIKVKLHPCHRMMAEIYSRFGEGRRLKTHLMGPNDWTQLAESLWQHSLWVNRIVKLEELYKAAQIGGDRKWQAEIAGEIAKTFLNLEGSK